MTEKFKYKYALESWISIPWVPEVFSRVRTGSFVSLAAGRRRERRSFSRGSLFKTRPKPETAHEKPLAPRVGFLQNWRLKINFTRQKWKYSKSVFHRLVNLFTVRFLCLIVRPWDCPQNRQTWDVWKSCKLITVMFCPRCRVEEKCWGF